MGYDLHLTRGQDNPIAEAEWRNYVTGDPEFDLAGVAEAPSPDGTLRYENPGLAVWRRHPEGAEVWFDFRRGRVVVKNPDEPTIEKMLVVARALAARVEGDDGEIYESPGGRPRPPRTSFADRIGGWIRRLTPAPKREPLTVPLTVGQRVRDCRGQPGTVTAVDLEANHGMGRIEVRFDDGRQLAFVVIGHGLGPIPDGEEEPSDEEGVRHHTRPRQ
jgi:hypothetical protein